MAITGQRPRAYNETTGQEDEVFFPANSILFDDGYSFQQKLDSGELRGQVGPQGIQGVQGPQGIQGPIGPAAEITIRVKKNDAGGVPTVEQTGSAAAGYNITLGIPSGLKGDTGEKGNDGITPVIDSNVDVVTGPAGSPASATITKNGNNYHLSLVIPQGEQGQSSSGGGTVVVDDVVSDTSPNPVRNSVIKAYVDNAINNLVDNAQEALNTLKELGDALGNDYDFAATVTRNLATKVDKEDGKGLSEQNYTLAEKNLLATVEEGAEKNLVRGVKGSANLEYSTEYISLSASDVGAADVNHSHDISSFRISGYSKKNPEALSQSDSIVDALGKLESKVDLKQDAGNYADHEHQHDSAEITSLDSFEARKAKHDDQIQTTDTLNIALAKLQARIDWMMEHCAFVDTDEEG